MCIRDRDKSKYPDCSVGIYVVYKGSRKNDTILVSTFPTKYIPEDLRNLTRLFIHLITSLWIVKTCP